MLSRDKKIAMDIATLGLTVKEIEIIDYLLKEGKNTKAQEKFLEICRVDRYKILNNNNRMSQMWTLFDKI